MNSLVSDRSKKKRKGSTRTREIWKAILLSLLRFQNFFPRTHYFFWSILPRAFFRLRSFVRVDTLEIPDYRNKFEPLLPIFIIWTKTLVDILYKSTGKQFKKMHHRWYTFSIYNRAYGTSMQINAWPISLSLCDLDFLSLDAKKNTNIIPEK